ncbi:MAG: tetratricopeptide repeat protein [Proteobacteria bacterium]|nr:tetratricopeptide repeat protein [Pseudomonadota bacterium]
MAPDVGAIVANANRFLRAGQWRDAEREIKRALLAWPGWPEGTREFGGLASRFGALDRAEKWLGRAIPLAPGDPRTWLLSCRARYGVRDVDGTGAAAMKAVILEPGYRAARSFVAAVAAHRGDFQKAELTLTRSRRIGPLDPPDLQIRLQSRLSLGLSSRARMTARCILLDAPANPAAISAMGRLLHMRRDSDAARRYFVRLGILQGGDGPTLTALSRVNLACRRFADAERFAQGALILGVNDGEAFLDLARSLWQRDDRPGAERMMARAIIVDEAMRLRARVLRLTVTRSSFATAFHRRVSPTRFTDVRRRSKK